MMESRVGIVVYFLVVVQNTRFISATFPSSEPHHCQRICEWPPTPRTCRYEFLLEWYSTMSTSCFDCPFNVTDCYRPECIPANGVPKAIAVVNRQLPGPSIQVCEFDTVEVQVRNELWNGEGVSIHWHGIHQRGTPHMDGVPLLTQCAIPHRSSFTYRFKAETVGTHFWHAHDMKRGDGLIGTLVVRQTSADDPHSSLYDWDLPEHVVLIQDWINQLSVDRFTKIVHYEVDLTPDSILFNGRTRSVELTQTDTNFTVRMPQGVFYVKPTQRYRFRMISNTMMDCFLELSIDGHNLTVIAVDGAPIQPVLVNVIGLSSGERVDFVLDANADIGKYWLRARGFDGCEDLPDELALVEYEGASQYPEPPEERPTSYPNGLVLTPYDSGDSSLVVNIDNISAAGDQAGPVQEATVVYYIGASINFVNNNVFNNPTYNPAFQTRGNETMFTGVPSPQMNYVTYRPPSAPLLTQPDDVHEFELCTFESTQAKQEHCKEEYCECTQVLNIALGEVVDLVLIDEGRIITNSHPFHLHGYRFQVLAHQKLGEETTLEEVRRLDREGNITRRTTDAPYKDTVSIPDGGYVVLRLVADNPGWWLFHCHVEIHMVAGMSLAIHVGTDEDLPPLPQDFPRCSNNWYPKDTDLPPPTATRTSTSAGHASKLNSGVVAANTVVVVFLLTVWL